MRREKINSNVLVIDDEEMVRDNIEEILVPRRNIKNTADIEQAASILFATPQAAAAPVNRNIPSFQVHKASNGMEGLELVKKSVLEANPYAVIFLDMRMPGWDGLRTATEIRKYDTQAEIIFVTAFSDRSIEEIVAQAGENVGYHCKPYASEEITQIATKAISDYSKLRNLERLIEAISSISLNEHQLNPLLQNILDQLATYVDTDSAILGKLHDDNTYEKIFSIGGFENRINFEELINIANAADVAAEEVRQEGEIVLARMSHYTIFAMLEKSDRLKTEKLYLLRLFVQNAARAIRNAELQEKLLQREKLSAIGSAVAMVMHDLRSPINNLSVLTQVMREEGVQSKSLDYIDQCGVQASEILNDFLDFTKETKIEKKRVSVNAVIEKTIHNFIRHPHNKKITVKLDIHPGLFIDGDESKFGRCLSNLVNNASDVLYDYKIPQPCITLSAQANEAGDKLSIVIRDNGPGIPPEIQKNLFEAFVTKNKSTGTGLGLAIVKQYITAHDGEIKAENKEGAVFTITLPLIN